MKTLNKREVPIFSLSFGDGADQNFLRTLSLQNFAFSRHIYEAADAALQLQNFYNQISSPLLTNVTFKYTQDVANVTRTYFPIYFHGGEIVIAGYIGKQPVGCAIDDCITPEITCDSFRGIIHLRPVCRRPVGELERLWAYLTIKQLLDKKDSSENGTGYEQEALRLALRYSFVTQLTSLVVVKPNGTSSGEPVAGRL